MQEMTEAAQVHSLEMFKNNIASWFFLLGGRQLFALLNTNAWDYLVTAD